MKTIVMIAATCAALCVVSPAEAGLYHGRLERIELKQVERVTTQTVVVPWSRRLTLRERFQALRAVRMELRMTRVSTEWISTTGISTTGISSN